MNSPSIQLDAHISLIGEYGFGLETVRIAINIPLGLILAEACQKVDV